jgi:hypothetical protein
MNTNLIETIFPHYQPQKRFLSKAAIDLAFSGRFCRGGYKSYTLEIKLSPQYFLQSISNDISYGL